MQFSAAFVKYAARQLFVHVHVSKIATAAVPTRYPALMLLGQPALCFWHPPI